MCRSRRIWGLACAVLALAATGCGNGSPDAPVRLDAGPAIAAAVTPVHVSISGLPAAGLVTVQARTTDDQGRPWQSSAVFRASAAGTLNLAMASPVSGSYDTADAAGLLWSLHPAFTSGPDTTFATSSAGFTVRLDVLIGGHVRATATLQRQLPVTASTQTVRQDGFAYYPGAGHHYFGMFPYYPFFADASLGGSAQANALATEQFWTRMITFLEHLAVA